VLGLGPTGGDEGLGCEGQGGRGGALMRRRRGAGINFMLHCIFIYYI
jgi:hypothetical protein